MASTTLPLGRKCRHCREVKDARYFTANAKVCQLCERKRSRDTYLGNVSARLHTLHKMLASVETDLEDCQPNTRATIKEVADVLLSLCLRVDDP